MTSHRFSSSTRRTVRLHGLRAIDESAVRIFLKFSAQQTHQHWELLADDEPALADLVLLNPDAIQAAATLTRARSAAWVIARDQQAPQDARCVLTRPLQLDAFYDLLRSLAALEAAGGAAPVLPVQPSPLAPVQPRQPLVSPQPPQPTQAAAAQLALPALRASLHGASRYRLRRWPGANLLSVHPDDTRLASFLSARFLTLEELLRLSRASANHCAVFLDRMQQAGLLEEHGAGPAQPGEPAAAVTGGNSLRTPEGPTPTPSHAQAEAALAIRAHAQPAGAVADGDARPELLSGFINRLRSRLGISRLVV